MSLIQNYVLIRDIDIKTAKNYELCELKFKYPDYLDEINPNLSSHIRIKLNISFETLENDLINDHSLIKKPKDTNWVEIKNLKNSITTDPLHASNQKMSINYETSEIERSPTMAPIHVTPKEFEFTYLEIFSKLLLGYFEFSIEIGQRASKVGFLNNYCWQKGYQARYTSFRTNKKFNELWSNLFPRYLQMIEQKVTHEK